jgi:hypothetical protein
MVRLLGEWPRISPRTSASIPQCPSGGALAPALVDFQPTTSLAFLVGTGLNYSVSTDSRDGVFSKSQIGAGSFPGRPIHKDSAQASALRHAARWIAPLRSRPSFVPRTISPARADVRSRDPPSGPLARLFIPEQKWQHVEPILAPLRRHENLHPVLEPEQPFPARGSRSADRMAKAASRRIVSRRCRTVAHRGRL